MNILPRITFYFSPLQNRHRVFSRPKYKAVCIYEMKYSIDCVLNMQGKHYLLFSCVRFMVVRRDILRPVSLISKACLLINSTTGHATHARWGSCGAQQQQSRVSSLDSKPRVLHGIRGVSNDVTVTTYACAVATE